LFIVPVLYEDLKMIEDGFSKEVLNQAIFEHLTALELLHGVVYLFSSVLPEGAKVLFSRTIIENPWDKAALVFVACNPTEECDSTSRFMLINLETGYARSYKTRQPPFQSNQASLWRFLFKAPSVPDESVRARPD
jgi:hypothetical protein